MKKTLVLGASLSRSRYSNLAIRKLKSYGAKVVAIGKVKGEIDETSILTDKSYLESVHTVTIYLNPVNQVMYYDYVISLKPQRVIFNPGSENSYFEEILEPEYDIKFEHSCTLVLINTDLYGLTSVNTLPVAANSTFSKVFLASSRKTSVFLYRFE